MKKKIIKLNAYTVVIIENQAVSIVQKLFKDQFIVVLNIDDVDRISRNVTTEHQSP